MILSPLLQRLRTGAALVALGSAALAGCATPAPGPDGNYARPIGSAPVTANPTPYTAALACVGGYAAQHGLQAPKIAVGRLSDLTGRLDENGGRSVTQGAALMAMSALGKAGVPLVERYETDVSKLEYQLADNKLIAADNLPPGGRRDYRAVMPGEMSGSAYFLTGGITELNSNIRGREAGVRAEKGGAVKVASLSGNDYVMNVGIDLRLVDTRSLDVVRLVSYQKQIIGHRISGDLFSFFGGNVVSLSAEAGGEEPVHLAVRSLIERAVLEIVTDLYRLPSIDFCMGGLDPLRATVVSEAGFAPAARQAPAYAAPAPIYAPLAPQAQASAYAPPLAAYAQSPAMYAAPAPHGAPPQAGWYLAPQGVLPAPAYVGRY
jgi:curli production assembly/transport component CsgG/holdfast attachment protein HfaB